VPPDKERAYRVAYGGTGGGLAGDKRKIAATKEELQSLDEPTRGFTAVRSRTRLSHHRSRLYLPMQRRS
jgi:hypothetical protein